MSIKECLQTYACNDLKKPPKGATYTPFIEVTINGEVLLMSGNASSPPSNNRAMINSFQYGASAGTGGCGCVIEAVDEGGTAYRKIADAINKDITKTRDEIKNFNLEFGWKITDCNGITKKITNIRGGEGPPAPIRLLPIKINTNFDGGLIKFTLECVDTITARSADNRLEKNIGSEDGKVALKKALEELFLNKDPKFTSIRLRRALPHPDGSDFVFNNKYGGKDGYWSVHSMDQETNVGCARKWINNTLTDNEKGILIMYNQEDGGVILLEEPDIDVKNCCGTGNLGTYIVNGGNESPVISFNPSFHWILSSNSGSGGVASGASSADGGDDKVKADETKNNNLQNTGTQTNYLSSNNKFHHQHPDNHASNTNETNTKHNNATKPYEIKSNIEAELKIIGDPSFVNPVLFTGRWVSIVVINPHYIAQDSKKGGCSWIVESNCNETLSNKQWMITGVDHQITSGSYVTTLKVYLTAPGVDKGVEKGLGCNGPKFKNISNTKVEK
jgi:hypothetical protein